MSNINQISILVQLTVDLKLLGFVHERHHLSCLSGSSLEATESFSLSLDSETLRHTCSQQLVQVLC